MVLVNFWRYPDPYQRFLIRIRNADLRKKEFAHVNIVLSKKYAQIKIDT